MSPEFGTEAFAALYREHRDHVFRYAYRMFGSVEPAEDATHDCFLSLWKRPGRYDPARASLRVYFYAAVRNLVRKRFRDLGREVAAEEVPAQAVNGNDGDPLRGLLDQELAEAVGRAVLALPPLQREVVVLFEYEELSLAEIASIVEADVGTVKARLHRARQGLRRMLTPPASREEMEENRSE